MTTGATSLPNDPTPGSVDENDFLYWRAHFGQSVGSGAGSASALSFATAVPEPSSYALALLAISLALLQARFGCPNTLRCVQKLDQSPPSV
jgi:PEP-CTERM motif